MSVSAISGSSGAAYTGYSSSVSAAGGHSSTSFQHSSSLSIGKDGASFSSDSMMMSHAMGSMGEQVIQLLVAAMALQGLGGKDDQDEDKNSALGLAMALAMMGQQQQSSFASTTSTVSMTPGSVACGYNAAGQSVTTGQTGGMVNAMA